MYKCNVLELDGKAGTAVSEAVVPVSVQSKTYLVLGQDSFLL
jgi:hypothetical protein